MQFENLKCTIDEALSLEGIIGNDWVGFCGWDLFYGHIEVFALQNQIDLNSCKKLIVN